MAWRKPDPELTTLFGRSMPTDPRVERRAMFGCPVALVDGAMFACVHQESFVLKLGDADRAVMRDQFDAHPYEFTPGRGVRDFVAMPDEVLNDPRALQDWIGRSMAYVSAKKRKPTTRAAKPKAASPKAKSKKAIKRAAKT